MVCYDFKFRKYCSVNRKDNPDEKNMFEFGMKKPDEVNRIKESYEEVAEEFYFKLKDEFIIEISQLNI